MQPQDELVLLKPTAITAAQYRHLPALLTIPELEHLGEQQLAQQQQEAAAAEAQREVWMHLWQQLAPAVYGGSGGVAAGAVSPAVAAPSTTQADHVDAEAPYNRSFTGSGSSSGGGVAISTSSGSSSPTSEGLRNAGPGVVVTGSDDHDSNIATQFLSDISGSRSADWEARRTSDNSSDTAAAAAVHSDTSGGNGSAAAAAAAAAAQRRPFPPSSSSSSSSSSGGGGGSSVGAGAIGSKRGLACASAFTSTDEVDATGEGGVSMVENTRRSKF